jgi:hypothetical protein
MPLVDATTDAARDVLRRAPLPACLGDGERVTMTGYFDAMSGALHVERTDPSPALRPSVSTCVTRALNALRVTPGGGRHDFYWTFSARDAVTSSEGQIDPQQVAAAIRERIPQIRNCYENRLRARPRLQGRLRVWFTVNTRGAIPQMVARASSADFADVGACILQQLRGATMPRATGGDVEFLFPFTFTPGGSP